MNYQLIQVTRKVGAIMNSKKLNEYLKEHGIKKKALAEAMKMTPVTLSNRLNGNTSFKDYELSAMLQFLRLTPEEFVNFFN